MAAPSSVDDYLAVLPEDRRAGLIELREIIRSVVPQATDTISYAMPACVANGQIFVWYAAFKNHYSLFPATDAMSKELGDELAPHLSGKGTIRFAADQPLPRALVTKIVRIRLAESAGDQR